MSPGGRVARVAWLAALGLLIGVVAAAAQTDVLKPLAGTWKGELQLPMQKTDPTVVLIISSVRQEDGKWVADGRLGASEARTAPVKVAIDTGGARPSVRFTGPAGYVYRLDLVDDKSLVGTVTLTIAAAGGASSRDRAVKLEKKQ